MDKKRILIVEDHPDSRELFVLILTRLGYDIAEAASGLEAIDQARAAHPDLILMDLGLLGITGDEATARIKADPATKDIPVIVYTAFHAESALVERALAAGAAEVLHKPISVPDLQEKVHQYLSWEKPADMSGHP
jgi:two-component system cell cycle response regulator DivK